VALLAAAPVADVRNMQAGPARPGEARIRPVPIALVLLRVQAWAQGQD